MTRKDYELIAGVFADYKLDCFEENAAACIYLARVMARRLEADNPRFDRARFLAACGVEV